MKLLRPTVFNKYNNRINKTTMVLTALLASSITGISGCDQARREPAVQQVEVPRTAALQAGMSISNRRSNYADNATAETKTDNQVKLSPTDKTVSKPNAKKVAIAETISIVSNKVTPGTPEAILKQAVDAQYSGSAKEAAKYYHTDIHNLVDELAKNQAQLQSTVEKFTIINTEFNKDKTQALLECEIKVKGELLPQKSIFRMQKINGKWKILG